MEDREDYKSEEKGGPRSSATTSTASFKYVTLEINCLLMFSTSENEMAEPKSRFDLD